MTSLLVFAAGFIVGFGVVVGVACLLAAGRADDRLGER